MKKRTGRVLTLVLAILMAAAVFSGCGGSGPDNSGAGAQVTDTQGAGAQAETATKEKMKVSWASWIEAPMDKDNYVLKTLDETFPDVDFELIGLERDTWLDQLNTRVAGGDIPDIMFRDWQGYVVDYVKQGLLAEVPLETIKKDAPNFFKESVAFGSEVWLATAYEGKNYGLPMLTLSNTKGGVSGWRQDWLENAGITKIPETLDEYEAAFLKFVNDDPDRNGKKDTFGLTARGKDSGAYLVFFPEIFGAYGVLPDAWCLEPDGTVKLGLTTERGKQALTTLAKWYGKGLIDPEFVTTDNAILTQKWNNSKIGYTANQTYNLTPTGDFYDALFAATPSAKIGLGYAPKGPQGKYGFRSYGKITGSLGFGKQLASDPAKLDRILQVLDQILTDKDLYTRLSCGIEGVHYTLDKATNVMTPVPPYDDASKRGPVGTTWWSTTPPIPSISDALASMVDKDLDKYSLDRNMLDNQDYFTWITMFTNPDITKQNQGATQVAAQWTISLITGARPMSNFDQFVKEWNAAGGDKLTEDANNAYKNGQSGLEAIKASIK